MARGRSCGRRRARRACRSTARPAERRRRRSADRSIFTPPRELQAAITNALRATGKLDDFEVGRPRARRRHEEDPSQAPPPLAERSCLRAALPHPLDRRPGLVSPHRHDVSGEDRIRLKPKGLPGGVRPPPRFREVLRRATPRRGRVRPRIRGVLSGSRVGSGRRQGPAGRWPVLAPAGGMNDREFAVGHVGQAPARQSRHR